MKKAFLFITAAAMTVMPLCGKTVTEANMSKEKDSATKNISMTVGDSVFSVKLHDNGAAKALQRKLPMTLNMSELNGNEKYYYLPESLPTHSQRVESIRSGELMLYGSDCLVIFYRDFQTSYRYTKLGYIEDTAALADALGNGSVLVTFTAAGL